MKSMSSIFRISFFFSLAAAAAFPPAYCTPRWTRAGGLLRAPAVQSSEGGWDYSEEDEEDECLTNADAALSKVQTKVTSNIIKGASKGGSYGVSVVNAAAKIKRATKAATGERAQGSDSRERMAAVVGEDPAVNDLAACLVAADDAQEVDACTSQYCDVDDKCAAAYSANSCDDDESTPSSRVNLMNEVDAVFTRYSCADGNLTYEDFLRLLTECSTESALFSGLLLFAEGAVKAGVQYRFSDVSAKESSNMGRKGSHILDNGTPAWRESIEAAFELCDDDLTGEVSAAATCTARQNTYPDTRCVRLARQITKAQLVEAVERYPLIAQLLRCPMDLTLTQEKEYLRTLFDSIDTDGGGSLDRDEWTQFFCAKKESVPRALEWDPEGAECQQVSGFIFDCDGTIYQPSGLIPGAEDLLTWLERSEQQYVLLSNTGAKPHSAVYDKLSEGAFECRPNGGPVPQGRIYTAADAQVDAPVDAVVT